MQNYYLTSSSIQVMKKTTPNVEDRKNHIETFTVKKARQETEKKKTEQEMEFFPNFLKIGE